MMRIYASSVRVHSRNSWAFVFFANDHACFGTRLFFAGLSSGLSFFSPEMEGVGENYIAEHMMRAVVGDVDGGIDLQISGQIAGDTNRG